MAKQLDREEIALINEDAQKLIEGFRMFDQAEFADAVRSAAMALAGKREIQDERGQAVMAKLVRYVVTSPTRNGYGVPFPWWWIFFEHEVLKGVDYDPWSEIRWWLFEELRGKVVIDTMNYYPGRDGDFPELDDESTTTSELLQAYLPESRVVKAFNNIFFQHLAALPRPAGDPERSALAIAGDDAGAKALVTTLLDRIGYDTLDLGDLAEGWRTQRDTAAYGVMYAADPVNWTAGASPTPTAELAQCAASAKRYRDS